jgi:hypothetical protein
MSKVRAQWRLRGPHQLREAWLNPPDLVERVPEVVRAIPTELSR